MLKKYTAHIILTLLMLFIVGSVLWSPGGIVLLDYVLTPHSMESTWWHPLFFPIIDGASRFFGYEIVSKVFFIGTLITSAYLGVLFARWIAEIFSETFETYTVRVMEVFGGIFFLLNPFAYERMMVQPTIYAGIIALGYGLYFLLSKKYWQTGIAMGIAWMLFPHASYMIVLVLGLYTILFIRTKKDGFGLMLLMGIIILINANWLIGSIFGMQPEGVGKIGTFDLANLEAFRTQALAPMDVWFTNILLYGFWGERFGNHYANVGFLSSLWYVAGFLLLGIMAIGKWRLWSMNIEQGIVNNERKKAGIAKNDYRDSVIARNEPMQISEKEEGESSRSDRDNDTKNQKLKTKSNSRKLVWFLGLIALFSLIFGIGIASPLTKGLTEWMIAHIPLWQGYREPQKWIGLLMIVEGVFLIMGIGFILQKYGKDIVVRCAIIASIALLFLTWSPGPLMGYHGQLKTTVYPQEFENLRQELLYHATQQSYHPTILALPWHSYLGCSWTGRPTIANPIKGLLAPLVVINADNIEVGSILYSNSSDTTSKKIEAFLKSHNFSDIADTDIGSILLMKQCANSELYTWLDTVGACKKITDNDKLSFYRCQN